jgi:AraC-like DNA-binding protein
MSLTPDDFAAAGRAIAGCDLTSPTEARLIHPPEHLMTRLMRLHEAAGHLAAKVPDVLAHPEVARAIEQELVRTMVLCLTEGTATGIDCTSRKAVMRRFEQIVQEVDTDRPLYVAEICATIGVSDRTLRLHCMEHFGMSPHRYLQLRRMNLARRALTQADPARTTVTTVANDHGFAELGRFAVVYRKLFGESPSTTLRRAP